MEQGKQLYRYSWIVLGSSVLAFCVYMFQRSDISTAIPDLMATYRWDPATVGLVNSAMIWSYSVMQIPFGYVSDRWLGARATISLGSVLLAIGAVLFGVFLPNVGLSVLVRILIGIGSAAILVPANSMLAQWFPSARRGLQTGILFFGGQVATIVASLLMPVLVGGAGSVAGLPAAQGAYILVSIPAIIALPFIVRFTRNRPEDVGLSPLAGTQVEGKVGREAESAGHLLRHSSTLYLLTFVYFGYIGASSINVWLAYFFVRVYGMSSVSAALLFTLVSLVPWLFGQPLAGLLGDRIGHRRIVRYSLAASLATIALLTLLVGLYGTIPLTVVLGLLALFWVFTSGMVNAWPLTTELFSTNVSGTVAGMMNTGGNLGGAAATLVPGYFVVAYPSCLPVFVFGTVMVVIGLTAALRLPSKGRGPG